MKNASNADDIVVRRDSIGSRSEEDPVVDDPRAIDRAFLRGRAVHGSLGLDLEGFRAGVAGRAGRIAAIGSGRKRTEGDPPRMAADLYLALACDAGCPDAWRRLADEFEPRVLAALLRRGVRLREAEEIVRDLGSELATPPANLSARTRIGTYDGAGSLFAFLVTIAARRLADRRRERRRRPPENGEEAIGSLFPGGRESNPAAAVVAAELAQRFEAALGDGFRSLRERERRVVADRYSLEIPQKAIASSLSLSESRLSRILDAALDKIARSVRRAVGGEELSWALASDALRARLRDSLGRILDRESARAFKLEPAGRKAEDERAR